MADTWGGIARAMEEGISRNEAASAREEMYPGHLEAARDANAHGIIGLLSGRHKAFVEDNKARMRELGINPSHRNEAGKLTGRYSSGDWKALQDALAGDQAVVTALGPENRPVGVPITGEINQSIQENAPWQREDELLNIRQWGTQNPNMPGSMALDPTWAGGLRGAGLGAEMTPGRDLNRLSRESRFDPGSVPGNLTGTRAYLPGRLSLGEARRERELRNRYNEARESSFDDENYRARMRGNPQRQGGEFLRNIYDSSGPTPPRSHPDWQAIEEDMAMREIRERQYEGRDHY